MRSKQYFGNRSAVSIILCVIIFSSILISCSQSALTTSKTISSSGSVNINLSRLHTDGRWIRDDARNIVRLKGAAVFWRFLYAYRDHDWDPLSYDDEIVEASLDTFKSTGANFIRLTVNGYIWHIEKAPKYIAAVNTVIQWCKDRKLMVVLDNHDWWGYQGGKYWNYTYNIDEIIELETWKAFMVSLAERYKNEPTVIGFDMCNEPGHPVYHWSKYGYTKEEAWNIWRTNVLEVIRAIHAVDPSYLCFVEPLGSSVDIDDMDEFKTEPLPEPNIVYSFHRYLAWDYGYDKRDYAVSYANGNFDLAREQMETLYYEVAFDMLDAGFPVANMESGVYRDISSWNPNWDVWMNDSLSLYEEYGVSVSWYLFDPDRSDSSLISILGSDRRSLTNVGDIWAMHMTVTA